MLINATESLAENVGVVPNCERHSVTTRFAGGSMDQPPVGMLVDKSNLQ